MRISNNMMTYGFLNSVDRSLNRMNTLQEQLSDGKAVHRPSDDPIKAIRSLKLNSNLNSNEQFTQNAQDATSWLETTDSALTSIGSIMQRAKEIVISAVSPKPDIAYTTAATEIDGLINAAINIGNTQIGDRYIFSGQKDKTQPFVLDASGNVIYNGDTNKISMPIQPGSVNPDQDSVNATGQEIFGSNMELINNLMAIKNQLATGNPDLTYLSTTALSNLEADTDRVLLEQTQIGTRMSMYELATNFLEGDNVTITANVSSNEDIDVAKALMDFKNNENVYNAALSVGSKIMPLSLVDFLK